MYTHGQTNMIDYPIANVVHIFKYIDNTLMRHLIFVSVLHDTICDIVHETRHGFSLHNAISQSENNGC